MSAIANFKHEDMVRSFKTRIADFDFIISNLNVASDQYTVFLYKLKGYKHIEAENHPKIKHILSMYQDWQNLNIF